MGKNLEFDACEMSSSEFISRHAAGRRAMVALPVFPSRVFRHGFITVNRKAVKTPKDLEGKRIGVPLYTMTAAVFIRGLLQDEYGVDLSGVHWVQGAINSAGVARQSDGAAAAQAGRDRAERVRPIAQRAARGRRDRGHHRQRPARALRTNPDVRGCFRTFTRVELRLLPAHAHLSDHASRRDPPRRLRAASVRRHEPLSTR